MILNHSQKNRLFFENYSASRDGFNFQVQESVVKAELGACEPTSLSIRLSSNETCNKHE